MPLDDFKPPAVPLCSQGLVSMLKLRLTMAIVDAKPSDAKTYLDIIDRLSKMAWLDDMTPKERAQQTRAEKNAATQAMNDYISQWLLDNPQE
jgi:hypothetical protein